MSVHRQPAREDDDGDAAREGTCAAWVAETDAKVGDVHENGWVVDADMVRHITEYKRIMSIAPHRQYEVFMRASNGLQGTADGVGWSADLQTLYIWDLKYGYGIVEAQNNWQLLCYVCLLLSSIPPAQYPRLIQVAIYQPRAMHRDGPYRKWVLDIDEALGFARQIQDRIAHINDMAVPGKHCAHCALAVGCDALTTTVYRMAETISESRAYIQPSPQQLSDELSMLDRFETLFSARKAAVHAEVEATIRDGKAIPGWALSNRYGKRRFTVSDLDVLITTGIDPSDSKTCTPAELIRRGADKEIVSTITTTPLIGASLIRWNARDLFPQSPQETSHNG